MRVRCLLFLNVLFYCLVPANLDVRSIHPDLSTAPLMETLQTMGHLSGRHIGIFRVTAYCSCPVCTGRSSPHIGGHGLTKSGAKPEEGRTVAADPKVLSMGSWIRIAGVGWRRVEDTGSAIHHRRLDIFVEDHQVAKAFGVKRLSVERRVK